MAIAAPIPNIVGALRCQKDSYLQSLESEVVSCEEYTPPKESSSGKSKTKRSTDPTKGLENGASQGGKTYLIEFADSVLFPEGGGQPTDHGTITPIISSNTPNATGNESPSETIPITSIQRHGLRCIYFSPTPLDPGTKVKQSVDYTRRWDHMQQHTGQHLLSAILDGLDIPTLSWSMAPAGEMNYIELPRKPTVEELSTIQTRCNQLIRDDLSITVDIPGTSSSSLPSDYDASKGVVRFIKIGDMDYNACCGTHLKQTSHISLILLHHTASVRGTNCRLYFTAGDRAISMAAEAINGLRNIAVGLSCGSKSDDVKKSVDRLGEQLSDARKREKKMLAEIAAVSAQKIIANLAKGGNAFLHRGEGGLDFINSVVFEIKDHLNEDGVVVLCSGEIKQAGSIVIMGKKGEKVDEMAAKVKGVVSSVKGGGKGKWQGKIVEWQKGEVEKLEAVVEES